MTDPNHRVDAADDLLLDHFRAWLRRARIDADADADAEVDADAGSPPPEVGLYRLVEEFTALRHEVKLETKGSRGLQEQVETLLGPLRQAVDLLRSVGPREEQAAQAAGRPLAEALADLDDALDRAHAELEKARDRPRPAPRSLAADLDRIFHEQPWYHRPGLAAYHARVLELIRQGEASDDPAPLDALVEGSSLVRDRLRRALEANQVRRIATVGHPVDPERMAVIAAIDAPDVEPGHVVDEVRRGYTWRGRVLRYAEVRAARGLTPAAPSAEDLV